ncbi:MAG: EVE domain-containing protein [Archaeoglobaceae archaeon]|nr:EVE domain-containing protein [Archaeoglobaceae archaeon]MDW8128124.1 EVE domain-containing protein [Archaeoglobaceae archaeon]
MTFWLCITTEENWEVIKAKNIWGVPERHKNTIAKVKKGDRLLIYLKQERRNEEIKEPRIVAEYEVISEVFKDPSRIFKSPKGMGNENFPLRIKIKPVEIFKAPLEFKPLIPRLELIKNKKKWTGHLMGKAMREISEKDYKLILSSKKK